jgi:guanylate kinase
LKKLLIFSAPSGAGKTTIVRHLLNKYPDHLEFSISATSRQPRAQEVDGRDYYFLSKEAFLEKVKNDEFAEWEEVYTQTYYGTLKSEIERIFKKNKSLIFDIDVIGGLNLKSKFGNNALAVFIEPPSIEELKKRLMERNTETPEKLKQRIEKASRELKYKSYFDAIIVNENLDAALRLAEKLTEEFLEIRK